MSLAVRVVFHPRAAEEVATIDAWWKANRPTAPDMFASELEDVLAAVLQSPTLGAPAQSREFAGTRRTLMRRTRYHLYYRIDGQDLEVLAVWHAQRGTGPGL